MVLSTSGLLLAFSCDSSTKTAATGAFSLNFSCRSILPLAFEGEFRCIHMFPSPHTLLNFMCAACAVAWHYIDQLLVHFWFFFFLGGGGLFHKKRSEYGCVLIDFLLHNCSSSHVPRLIRIEIRGPQCEKKFSYDIELSTFFFKSTNVRK